MTTTTTATTGTALSEAVTFSGLVRLSGKGVTAHEKARQARANGAEVGALLHAGKHRKAIVDGIESQGVQSTIHALSVGNIRPVCALLVEVSGKAVSLMEIDGKAPYSEFLRMGATLAGFPKVNSKGKPTPTGKALALFEDYKAKAQSMREARETRKKESRALQDAALTTTDTTTDTEREWRKAKAQAFAEAGLSAPAPAPSPAPAPAPEPALL